MSATNVPERMAEPLPDVHMEEGRQKSFSVSSATGLVFSRQSSVLSAHEHLADGELKKRKLFKSKRDVFVYISMALFYFSVMCAYSMIAPFFPTEGKKRGVRLAVVGLIFAVFPFVVFICSPIVGLLLPRLGSKFTLMIGLFIEGTTQILFGFLDMMPDKTNFVLFSFLIRIVSGMGSAGTSTASMAIITETFGDNMATAMSFLETLGGIGLMTGPVVGGFLFAAGGFKLPFLTVGGIILIFLIPVYFVLPGSPVQRFEDSEEEDKKSPLLAYKNPAIMIAASAVAMGGILIGYLDPTLAIHLKQFHIDTGKTGLFFIIAPAVYALLAPLIGFLSDRWDTRMLIGLGAFLSSVSFFFLGPSPLLESYVPRALWFNGISLAVLGLGFSPLVIPTIADMHRSAKRAGMPDNLGTHGIISGIFNSMFNIGGIVGPTIAGSFADKLGFPWACTILSFLLLTETLVIFCFTLYERRKLRRHADNADESTPLIQ